MTPYLLRSLGERCARFLPRSLGWQIVDTLRGELGKAGSSVVSEATDVLDVYVGDVENFIIDTVQRIEDDVRRIVDNDVPDKTWSDLGFDKVFWRGDVPKVDIAAVVSGLDVTPACVEAFLDGLELGLGSREARRA